MFTTRGRNGKGGSFITGAIVVCLLGMMVYAQGSSSGAHAQTAPRAVNPGSALQAPTGGAGFDCDGDNVPDLFEDPVVIFQNVSDEVGVLDSVARAAQDIHLGSVGTAFLTQLDVHYRSTGSSPGTMIVRLYENDLVDSLLPCGGTGGLIAEFVLGDLEQTLKEFAIISQAIDPALAIPQSLWIEVELNGDAGVVLRAEPPDVGFSHGLIYDCAEQTFGDPPQYMGLALQGVICEPDCNGNSIPDDQETDTDGDMLIDDCDECPSDPQVIEVSEESLEADTCSNGVDDDCDGLTDTDDPGCSPGTCVCGDPNGDGLVDLSDFLVFARCFGLTAPSGQCGVNEWACSDLNVSGEVNLADFVTFAQLFGGSASGSPPNCGT